MRMAIVRRLASGVEYPCGWLGLPISKSTLTHHLHVLHHAGIVVKREEGTRRMISLDRAGMESRFPGLSTRCWAPPTPRPSPSPETTPPVAADGRGGAGRVAARHSASRPSQPGGASDGGDLRARRDLRKSPRAAAS